MPSKVIEYVCEGYRWEKKYVGGGHFPGPLPLAAISAQQAYQLYPNPRNGSITLKQGVEADGPATVQIWNATGVLEYNQKVQFSG